MYLLVEDLAFRICLWITRNTAAAIEDRVLSINKIFNLHYYCTRLISLNVISEQIEICSDCILQFFSVFTLINRTSISYKDEGLTSSYGNVDKLIFIFHLMQIMLQVIIIWSVSSSDSFFMELHTVQLKTTTLSCVVL